MIEDKLDLRQRIRLEALAQANARFAMVGVPKNDFFDTVKDFEEYIRTGHIAWEDETKETAQ